jgi:cyclophilin family peptidyl-prolyl cis-trans isomerase
MTRMPAWLGPIRCLYASFIIALCLYSGCSDSDQEPSPPEPHPVVRLSTTIGDISLDLDAERAPISAENFLDYVETGFYDSTIIHRVIPGFVIQGGGFTLGLARKHAGDPIICESYNGLSNARGTIACARTVDPNSATSQFFINLVDNKALDRTANSVGYAVFGHVISGMDVVDSIAAAPTSTQHGPAGTFDDVPVTPVFVLSAKRIK